MADSLSDQHGTEFRAAKSGDFLMRNTLTIILLISCISGCATIVSGSAQKLTFDSDPQGAVVTLIGKTKVREIGRTPLTIEVPRRKFQQISLDAEGYESRTLDLTTTLNGWFWGNLVIGGLPGSTTDASSGGSVEYAPQQYFVTLKSKTPPVTPVADARARFIKQAFVGFGPEIRLELVAGGGKNLDEVVAALGLTEAERPKAMVTLSALANSEADNLELARKVIDVFEVR